MFAKLYMLVWYFIPWLFLKNYLPWCKYYLELSLLPQLRDDLPKYGNPKLISVSFSSCNYIVSHSVRFLGSDSNIIEVIILIIRWEIQSLSHGKSAFCLSSLFFFFFSAHIISHTNEEYLYFRMYSNNADFQWWSFLS